MNTTTALVRRGRKRLCSDRTLEYVVDLHRAGMSLRGIAARLNDEGVRTPSGGVRWHHSYVDGLLHTHGGRAMLKARSTLYPVPPALTDLTPPGVQAIAHTEKAATSCRSEKTLRPGQTRKSLSAEADVATFSRRSCSVGKVTDKQGRTDRLSGGAVARRPPQPDLPRLGVRLCGNDVRALAQRVGVARVLPCHSFTRRENAVVGAVGKGDVPQRSTESVDVAGRRIPDQSDLSAIQHPVCPLACLRSPTLHRRIRFHCLRSVDTQHPDPDLRTVDELDVGGVAVDDVDNLPRGAPLQRRRCEARHVQLTARQRESGTERGRSRRGHPPPGSASCGRLALRGSHGAPFDPRE